MLPGTIPGKLPVGTIVTVQAPGSRGSAGEAQEIPAVVLKQYQDFSLDLYAFHFEGVPVLMRAVPLANVAVPEPVKTPREQPKFSLAPHEAT